MFATKRAANSGQISNRFMLGFVAHTHRHTHTDTHIPWEPQVLAVMAMKWVLAEWGFQPQFEHHPPLQFGRRAPRSQHSLLCISSSPPSPDIYHYPHLSLSWSVLFIMCPFFFPASRWRGKKAFSFDAAWTLWAKNKMLKMWFWLRWVAASFSF